MIWRGDQQKFCKKSAPHHIVRRRKGKGTALAAQAGGDPAGETERDQLAGYTVAITDNPVAGAHSELSTRPTDVVLPAAVLLVVRITILVQGVAHATPMKRDVISDTTPVELALPRLPQLAPPLLQPLRVESRVGVELRLLHERRQQVDAPRPTGTVTDLRLEAAEVGVSLHHCALADHDERAPPDVLAATNADAKRLVVGLRLVAVATERGRHVEQVGLEHGEPPGLG